MATFYTYAWNGGPAFLYGPTGIGKTNACLQVARDFAQKGWNVLMLTEDDPRKLRGRLIQANPDVFAEPDAGRVYISRYRDETDLDTLDNPGLDAPNIDLYILDASLTKGTIDQIVAWSRDVSGAVTSASVPVLITLQSRRGISGGDAMAIPTKRQYEANALFGIEVDNAGNIFAIVHKHRFQPTGGIIPVHTPWMKQVVA